MEEEGRRQREVSSSERETTGHQESKKNRYCTWDHGRPMSARRLKIGFWSHFWGKNNKDGSASPVHDDDHF